jgi:NitT/TauT family transport system permease protein
MSREGTELIAEMPAPTTQAIEAASVQPKGAAWRGCDVASLAAIPVTTGVALAFHFWLGNQVAAMGTPTHTYPAILGALMVVGVLGIISAMSWPGGRRWFVERAPLVGAAIMTMCVWELVTIKLGWLPLMYFPPPETVFQTLIDERTALFDSTWHSLTLLLSGYFVGVLAGLCTGITIGWSRHARYWGMPALKLIGPIPATAWIPTALVVFPQSMAAGVFLIALAVWFPVTMLTASGVSNVRASYLDVARTLGAGRMYLIFRVAIPAAMPSIFIGLFMGLGTSFLTLLVAESTGVSSGLGWYMDWARNYSDYNKVFAALMIMAIFFSAIMTLLFKVRDWVLVWQKGVIKW